MLSIGLIFLCLTFKFLHIPLIKFTGFFHIPCMIFMVFLHIINFLHTLWIIVFLFFNMSCIIVFLFLYMLCMIVFIIFSWCLIVVKFGCPYVGLIFIYQWINTRRIVDGSRWGVLVVLLADRAKPWSCLDVELSFIRLCRTGCHRIYMGWLL